MFILVVIFFFQAEDGIRDLVRSRGLGDVYKRQSGHWLAAPWRTGGAFLIMGDFLSVVLIFAPLVLAVSYTHLMLPTSDLV